MLGHVFVANMTGNVVFVAFGLAGVGGFSIVSSIVALASFVLAALVSVALLARFQKNRGRLLASCAALQIVLFAVAIFLALSSGEPLLGVYLYALIVVLAISMGFQNAVARKLGVPDLTTTVLTLTLTGIGADSHIVGGSGSKAGRRLIPVIAMFPGALVSALLITRVSTVYPLVIAFAIVAGVASSARFLSRGDQAWTRPR